MNKKYLGMTIKIMRTELGLTQENLAEKLNCDQSAIARWESGANEPTLQFVVKLAAIFGTSTDYLLGVSDNF